jgi:hypothetical protein
MYTTTTTSTMRVSLPCCPVAWLYLNFAVRCDYSSSGCTGPIAPMTCIRMRRLAARLLVSRSHWLSSCALFTPSRGSTSLSLNLLSGRTGSTSATPCAATTRLPVASAIHHLRRAPRLLVTRSHGLYVNLSVHREYLSPGHSGSTSTTPHDRVHRLPAPSVRVSRYVARLVVDYFAYAVRPGASACRVARLVARRRLLCPASLVVDYFASRRLVVDYFAYAARPGDLARRAARRRLLLPRRASGCLGTLCGSLHGSSSTTSPTPHI